MKSSMQTCISLSSCTPQDQNDQFIIADSVSFIAILTLISAHIRASDHAICLIVGLVVCRSFRFLALNMRARAGLALRSTLERDLFPG